MRRTGRPGTPSGSVRPFAHRRRDRRSQIFTAVMALSSDHQPAAVGGEGHPDQSGAQSRRREAEQLASCRRRRSPRSAPSRPRWTWRGGCRRDSNRPLDRVLCPVQRERVLPGSRLPDPGRTSPSAVARRSTCRPGSRPRSGRPQSSPPSSASNFLAGEGVKHDAASRSATTTAAARARTQCRRPPPTRSRR